MRLLRILLLLAGTLALSADDTSADPATSVAPGEAALSGDMPVAEAASLIVPANATLSRSPLLRGFECVGGVRNALNRRYSYPTTWPLNNTADQIPADGRAALVKLIRTHGE
ncbi:MAG TPA: hypothetical protein VKR61_22225 [Bryobacteraceae bacterium]|nr:hypothetical protein [Bryobacteraceae bacterium]